MSSRSSGRIWFAFLLFALLVLFLCAAFALCSTSTLLWLRRARSTPTPTAEAAPTSTGLDTETLLANTHIPPLEPYDLARRLKHTAEPFPTALFRHPVSRVTPASPLQYSLGDQESFWVLNLDTIEAFRVQATLRHISPHLYIWVQDDINVQQDALERSAKAFEEQSYPTVRHYFGSEWRPGIDNDPRLAILNARFSGALGYFSSGDEFPTAVMPYSNQREMFYINPDHAPPGSASYDGTLAHEFQHMVHWFADSNEDTWVNEGASELAMHLCGYPREARINLFAHNPDTQLTTWDSYSTTEHYGASFLFLAYFAERFGPEMTRELVANELNGIAGFESVLQAHQSNLSFQDLFADWVIANYLDGESNVDHITYAYEGLDVQVQVERTVSSYPTQGDGTVHQYAADYIELQPAGQDVRLDFSSPATTRLIRNEAHSGQYQWWSNRGDNSNMTLTRSFDLSGLSKASLDVWLWHDIEEGWDYAYVEASTDGGETWNILPGKYTTMKNPSGNSYGPGYTGKSVADHSSSGQGDDTAGDAEWIHETFDLSSFTGQPVWIRFEYLTDDAVNHPGLCIDDIAIPELGYFYNAEEGDGGWLAEGFIRSDNTLPQRYIIQLIRIASTQGAREAAGKVTIERLSLHSDLAPSGQGEEQTGSWTLGGFDDGLKKAILVITAVAPSTTEPASYHYEIHPVD